MILRDVAHDAESEPGAAGLAGAAGINAIEAFEDSFEVFGRNAHALVGNGDVHEWTDGLTLFIERCLYAFDADAHRSAFRRVHHRIF